MPRDPTETLNAARPVIPREAYKGGCVGSQNELVALPEGRCSSPGTRAFSFAFSAAVVVVRCCCGSDVRGPQRAEINVFQGRIPPYPLQWFCWVSWEPRAWQPQRCEGCRVFLPPLEGESLTHRPGVHFPRPRWGPFWALNPGLGAPRSGRSLPLGVRTGRFRARTVTQAQLAPNPVSQPLLLYLRFPFAFCQSLWKTRVSQRFGPDNSLWWELCIVGR